MSIDCRCRSSLDYCPANFITTLETTSSSQAVKCSRRQTCQTPPEKTYATQTNCRINNMSVLTDQSRSHLIYDSSQTINRSPSVTVNGVSCSLHPSSSRPSSIAVRNNPSLLAVTSQSTTRTTTTTTTSSGLTGPDATSVKKVICELEATFGKRNLTQVEEEEQQQHLELPSPLQPTKVPLTLNRAILPFSLTNHRNHSSSTSVKQPLLQFSSSSSSQQKSPSDSSVKTQTEREAPESLTPSPEVKRHLNQPTKYSTAVFKTKPSTIPVKPSMESDSSCHHHQEDHYPKHNHHHHRHSTTLKSPKVPPLTTVSVSTCPSCGSENVSSESMPSSAATKRSLSFQHLIHDKHHRETTSSGDCNGNHCHPSHSTSKPQSSSKILTPMNQHKSSCHEPHGGVNRSKSFSYNLLMSQEASSSSSCLTCKGCDCDYVPPVPNPRLLNDNLLLSSRKNQSNFTSDAIYSTRPYFDHNNGRKLRRKKTTRVASSKKVNVPTVFGGDHGNSRSSRPSYLSLHPDQEPVYRHPRLLLPPPSSKMPMFLPMMPPPLGYCPCPECETSAKFDPLENILRRNGHHHRGRHANRHAVDRSRSFHVSTGNPHVDSKLMNNYRYWDVDEWRAQVRREKLKKKERRALLTVCAVGIIVFIAVSYFGTLLFLRITRFPASTLHSSHHGI